MFDFKKLSAAVLAAAMTLSLAACGNGGTEETTAETTTAVVEEEASKRITIEGTKFMLNGKEWWINGVNTPWIDWNEFGGTVNEEKWDATFEQLAKDNINCTRVWINCSGESIMRIKTTGEPQAINDVHWTNVDKLFALAEKHGVYIMATLLSFDHFKEPNGGFNEWRLLVQNKEYCDLYAEMYVKEFCKRYGDNDYLFSIDIMNEPDWVYENEECGQIGFEHLSYLFGTVAATIHENCDALVTVGMGMPKYNSDKYQGNYVSDEFLKEITGNENAYLDFYSPHYYSWMLPSFGLPFTQTAESYGIDPSKPCVIGETPNDDEGAIGISVADKYVKAYENGWNGVMIWMDPKQENPYGWYEYELTQSATNKMYELIPELIYPEGK
ncbi:MAG: cellulase family glycosylhydrolase [Oscillospiraceae bacterium]|nr:cellulase family glycosylhydrolase [Oscillospiraceae bacterium]